MRMNKSLAIASTAVILAGSAMLSPKVHAPAYDDYNGNIIYIASAPSIESRLKAENAVFGIDPGHDDKYVGCHVKDSKGKKIKEEDLNLNLSEKLDTLLTEAGSEVHKTRSSGTRINVKNLDLDDEKGIDVGDEVAARSDYLKNTPSDCDIIIHHNANRSKAYNGMEIYFFGTKSNWFLKNKKLDFFYPENCRIYSEPSMLIAKKLGQYISEQGITVSVIGSDMKILEQNKDKMILYLEMGYMSNPSDLKKITDPEWQNMMAALLKNFLEENIAYIKKVNNDYALKKNLTCIMKPQQDKDSTNLENMMNNYFWNLKKVSPSPKYPFY
ncbi:MAG: N-acetylmuramoyl-L-alanine amidase [Candidatus Woesearchaeota archaeon]